MSPSRTAPLDKAYDPHRVEQRIYELWEGQDLFRARPDSGKPPYTIMIPPPNVTGVLHMGHALNNTIQDVIIRRSRMTGRPTRWVVGTDPAGTSL